MFFQIFTAKSAHICRSDGLVTNQREPLVVWMCPESGDRRPVLIKTTQVKMWLCVLMNAAHSSRAGSCCHSTPAGRRCDGKEAACCQPGHCLVLARHPPTPRLDAVVRCQCCVLGSLPRRRMTTAAPPQGPLDGSTHLQYPPRDWHVIRSKIHPQQTKMDSFLKQTVSTSPFNCSRPPPMINWGVPPQWKVG